MVVAADALRKELKKGKLDQHFGFEVTASSQEIEESKGTDGWSTTIALQDDNLSISVWFDRFLGGKVRHFWVGFEAHDARWIERLASKDLPARFRPKHEYRKRRDVIKSKPRRLAI